MFLEQIHSISKVSENLFLIFDFYWRFKSFLVVSNYFVLHVIRYYSWILFLSVTSLEENLWPKCSWLYQLLLQYSNHISWPQAQTWATWRCSPPSCPCSLQDLSLNPGKSTTKNRRQQVFCNSVAYNIIPKIGYIMCEPALLYISIHY